MQPPAPAEQQAREEPRDRWEAPLAFVGQATSEVRSKLEAAEVPHALLVDSNRRPLGWLSRRDLEGGLPAPA